MLNSSCEKVRMAQIQLLMKNDTECLQKAVQDSGDDAEPARTVMQQSYQYWFSHLIYSQMKACQVNDLLLLGFPLRETPRISPSLKMNYRELPLKPLTWIRFYYYVTILVCEKHSFVKILYLGCHLEYSDLSFWKLHGEIIKLIHNPTITYTKA